MCGEKWTQLLLVEELKKGPYLCLRKQYFTCMHKFTRLTLQQGRVLISICHCKIAMQDKNKLWRKLSHTHAHTQNRPSWKAPLFSVLGTCWHGGKELCWWVSCRVTCLVDWATKIKLKMTCSIHWIPLFKALPQTSW